MSVTASGVGADEAADLGHVVGLARVTYVSGSSVYIDAGREHGLESGQTLEVLRDGQEVGHVRIDNISAIRAACKIVDGEPILTVGDLVRLPIPGGGSESIRPFDEGLAIEHDGKQIDLPNDAVIVCAGGILPTPFLKKIGIEVETKHGTV